MFLKIMEKIQKTRVTTSITRYSSWITNKVTI